MWKKALATVWRDCLQSVVSAQWSVVCSHKSGHDGWTLRTNRETPRESDETTRSLPLSHLPLCCTLRPGADCGRRTEVRLPAPRHRPRPFRVAEGARCAPADGFSLAGQVQRGRFGAGAARRRRKPRGFHGRLDHRGLALQLSQALSRQAYINRGISGQNTPQMLVRFRQDVIALQPKVVVILAGTNDIAGNTGRRRWSRLKTTWPRWPTWPRPIIFAWCCVRCCRPSIFPGGRE